MGKNIQKVKKKRINPKPVFSVCVALVLLGHLLPFFLLNARARVCVCAIMYVFWGRRTWYRRGYVSRQLPLTKGVGPFFLFSNIASNGEGRGGGMGWGRPVGVGALRGWEGCVCHGARQ